MIVEQFVRKSFPVEAVRVTATNMEEVAQWCDGSIRTEVHKGKEGDQPFIKVRVDNPLTERQTKAFIGDWVLYAGRGYKVYTDKAFRKSFDENGVKAENKPLPTGVTATVVMDKDGGVPENVFAAEFSASGGGTSGPNPGGTSHV